MKRIVKVEIKNFQSHANTVINFDSGFNALVGQSDQGKTAIFRAINWALYNKPNGTGFIRRGSSACEVILLFNDETQIIRHRSSRENYYEIVYSDGRIQRFEGFGIHPPEEVLMAHGMRMVNLNGTKETLNLSYQLDGPFMLKDSPNARAIALGRMAHTEIIDRSIKDVASDVLAQRKEAKQLNAEVIALQDQLDEFNDLDIIKDKITIIEDKIESLENKVATYKRVDEISQKLFSEKEKAAKIGETISRNEVFVEILVNVDNVLNIYKNYVTVGNLYLRLASELKRSDSTNKILEANRDFSKILDAVILLETKINNFKNISDKISSLEKFNLESHKLRDIVSNNADIDKIIPHIEDCQYKLIDYNKINQTNSKLISQQERVTKGEAVISEIEEQLNELILKYKEAIKDAGKCPTCFSEIGDDILENVSKNLF